MTCAIETVLPEPDSPLTTTACMRGAVASSTWGGGLLARGGCRLECARLQALARRAAASSTRVGLQPVELQSCRAVGPHLALAVTLQPAVGQLCDGEGVGRQLPQGEGGQRGGESVRVEVDL